MTTPLTLRSVKGSPLEWAEVDGNFTALRATADAALRVLTADLDFYVRADGDDTNDGLANTAGRAFATPRRAFVEACKYAKADGRLRINVGPGTYNDPPAYAGARWTNAVTGIPNDAIEFIGDPATPSNVVLASNVELFIGSFSFNGFTFAGWVSLSVGYGFLTNCVFGTVYSTYHATLYCYNCELNVAPLYGFAFNASVGASLELEAITVLGTRAYPNGFITADACSQVFFYDQPAVVGVVTGKRYNVSTNAVIETYGGGANYLPGDVAGTTASGGQYV